jgi:hypothetical protein
MVAEVRIIAAPFPDSSDAQAAVQDLRQHGFSEHDISVVYTNAGQTVRAGLFSGAVWGGVVGAMRGFLFPPVGLLVVAGPIAGVLASWATLGAAAALTVGGLNALISGPVQLGVSEEIATRLGEQVHKGDTLVIAYASSPEAATQAQQVLAAHRPRIEAAPTGTET